MSDERLEIVVESEASQASAEMDKLIEQFDRLGSKLDVLTKTLQGSNSSISKNVKNIGKSVKSESQSIIKSLAKISATIYTLKRTFQGLAKSIKSAMDYQETVHLFSTVFTRLGRKAGEDFYEGFFDRINEFQSKFIRLGIDPDALMNFQAVFAQMADSMGVLPETAYAISESFTALGADLSALFNLPIEDAMLKLQAGLSGQIRPLRQLGIDISKTTLMEEARMRGIKKSIEVMTASEKVQLRYLAIMRQTMVAHGDMAKTIMSPANSLRVLTQQFKMAGRAIGSIFLPVVQKLLPYLTAVAIVIQRIASFIAGLFGYELPKLHEAVTFDYDDGILGDWDKEQDNIGKTGKALKKLKSRLMGFDEINILPDQQDPSSGAGGGKGGMGAGASFDLSDEILKMNEEYQKMIDEVLANTTYKAEEIANNIIEALLKIKEASEPTIESLKRLGKALEPLKTFVAKGLSDFYHEFLVPVGKWTLGEGLPRLIDALANGLEKINWGIINDSLKGLWEALTPFAINVGEGLLWFWENVLIPLGTWTMNEIVPRFLNILAESIRVLNSVIEALKPLGSWLWENFLKPLAEWTGEVILQALDWLNDKLTTLSTWIQENQSTIENLTIIVGSFAAAWGLVNAAITIWNGIALIAAGVTTVFGAAIGFLTSPIGIVITVIGALIAIGILLYKNWDEIGPFLKETWESIKSKAEEIWNGIKEFFSNTWENIKKKTSETWNNVKNFLIEKIWQPILNFIDKTFVKNFKRGFETLGGIVDNFKTNVDRVISSVKEIFEGIITFVTGVFTGDWEKAWNGVVQVFDTIVSGLGNIFKRPLNVIIDGINSFLRGLNKIKIPDWVPGVGGKGFNIPEIPRLATGGVLNAGQLFIANEAGPELVGNYGRKTAVLNNAQIVDAVSVGVYKAVSSALGSQGGESLNLTVKIGENTITDLIVEDIRRKNRISGGTIIEV